MKATTHKINRPGMTVESPRNPKPVQQSAPKQQQPSQRPKERAQSVNNPKTPSENTPKGNNAKELDIKTAWKSVHKIGPGLVNAGNTCFLNSVLQMLTYTPPFANYLLDKVHSRNCSKKNGQFCALCAFENHVNKVFSGTKQREIQPTEILKNVKQINKKFRIGRQEDSQEFLRDLIDAFQKSCTGFVEKPAPKLLETTDISKMFGGKLKSSVECKECHHKSEIFENFFDLSLELNKNDSIQKCLDVFFKAEELKGSNKYRCSSCNKLVEATKKFSIHQRPVVLTIHLKRFDNLFMRISKINRHIQFPETLSLKPYIDDKTSNPLVYDLQGMVIHMGSGCSCGHYFSYVKNSNNSWFLMNDEDVRPSQIQNVMKQNAYLLTYVLRGPVEKIPATVAEEVPAAEPTKMNIEKPLKQAVEKQQKKEPTMRDLEEKEEEEPKAKAPVALFGDKANKKPEENKKNGPMQIETEGENKSKLQLKEKEKARERAKSQQPAEKKKESLNKTMPPPAQKPVEKVQEPAPAAQEKSMSEKIFERLSQPSKVTPANFSLNSILEDNLDAPVSKKRMEISQSLFRAPTLNRASSLVKPKDAMVEEVASKPAVAEKKIEIPVLKEEEKISYSKKLEALLDQKEARTYMSKLDSLVASKAAPSLKRSLSTGDAGLLNMSRSNSLPLMEPVLRKSLSMAKSSMTKSQFLNLLNPVFGIKNSPLMKLKRMSKKSLPFTIKRLKGSVGQEVSIGSSNSTEETQDCSPLKKPVYQVPKKNGLLGDERGRLNKIREADEWGGDQELVKLQKTFEKKNSMVEDLAPMKRQMSIEGIKGKMEKGQFNKKMMKMNGF